MSAVRKQAGKSEPKTKSRAPASRAHRPPRRGIGAWYAALLVATVGFLFWLADISKVPLSSRPLTGLVEQQRARDIETSLKADESLGRFLHERIAARAFLMRDAVYRIILDFFGRAGQTDLLVIKRLGEYEGPYWKVRFDGHNWGAASRMLRRMFETNPIGAYRLERARPGTRPLEHVDFTLFCSPLQHGLDVDGDGRLTGPESSAWQLHHEPLALIPGPRAGGRPGESITFDRARLTPRAGQLVFFLKHALIAGALALPLGPGMQLVLPAWNGDRVPHLVVESAHESHTYSLAMSPKQAVDVSHDVLLCVELKEVLGALIPVNLRVALDGRYYEWKETLPARLPQLPRSYVPELRNYGASRFAVTQFEIAQVYTD